MYFVAADYAVCRWKMCCIKAVFIYGASERRKDMLDILQRGIKIVDRVREMGILSQTAVVLFGGILAFGILNCFLGYRLLRFWMMLFGFAIGAGIGVFGAYQFGIQEKYMYLAVGAGCGVVLAIIAFLSYRAGVFIMGAGLGLSLGIYAIHPTSSLTFFLCILAGVGLGVLAVRFEREVLIVGTSILGGVLSGFATAKLLRMEEIPYGILMSAGYAFVGILIQFALNRPSDRQEEDYDDFSDKRSIRAGGQRIPDGNQRTPEENFDETVYERIYNSLDEEDIEEAYLKEKVLNEAEADPVEDFISEKFDEVKEHHHKKHEPFSKGENQRKSKTALSRKETVSSKGNSGSIRRETEASAGSNGASCKKASPSRSLRQVDFPLTDDEEIAFVHQKVWEQKKRQDK